MSQEKLKIFKGECNFIAGAAEVGQIPFTNLPEVAFIGRSNVGKSSLINSILHRKTLVRVSQNPGRTRQINFFNLAEKLIFVDLPGYGFARRSHAELNQWSDLITSYLTNSKNLKRVFLLIDSRHEIKDSDLTAMDFLDQNDIPYQLVLTKTDKKPMLKAESVAELISHRQACQPKVIETSTKTGTGLDILRHTILEAAN